MNRLSSILVDTPRTSAPTAESAATFGQAVEAPALPAHGDTLASLELSDRPSGQSSQAEATGPQGATPPSPLSQIFSALRQLYDRSQAAGASPETTVAEVALKLPPVPPLSTIPLDPKPALRGQPSTSLGTKARATMVLSPQQIIEALHRDLPVGLELHRAYHYQVPFSKRSRLDLVVLKLYCPPELEQKLAEWRLRMDERFDPVTILVRRVTVENDILKQLRNRFHETSLLTNTAIGTVTEMISSICGPRPALPVVLSARRRSRDDLTAIPFVAIDRPGTRDREDLLHAERRPNGELVWRAAFIDATEYVEPGSHLDRYALRVGSTIFGRSTTIPTLGEHLSHDLLSFHVGEVRPAWVLEGILTPRHVTTNSGRTHVEYSLQYQVRSAVVINHKNIDPEAPIDTAADRDEVSASLAALSEVCRILEQRRTLRPALLRIEGESAASKIVAETMIESKRLLAHFLGTRHGVPAIYRVHKKPSVAVVESFVNDLATLGIPASVVDFEKPAEFAGILRSLESQGSADAQALLNSLIDTYLLRSLYSTKNDGHFGLRLDGFLEIKPRDAAGLANGFQLRAIFDECQPLSAREMARRAALLNEKRWQRDELHYNLRFLEMLREHLADVNSKTFLATVVKTKRTTPYLEVEGFSKWGVLDGVPEGECLYRGAPVAVKLKGFDLNRKRFRLGYIR